MRKVSVADWLLIVGGAIALAILVLWAEGRNGRAIPMQLDAAWRSA